MPQGGNNMIFDLLWFFVIYAVLGWCLEVVFAGFLKHRFVNRGFLNGPYCPIYGIGVTLIVTLLEPVKSNLFLLYLGSVVILSTIELITGYILEKLFHQKWWDYSEKRFNLGGYICLKFSLFWGFAILFAVLFVHPIIVNLVNSIPDPYRIGLIVLIMSGIFLDFLITIKSIVKMSRWIEMSNTILSKITEVSNNLKSLYESGALSLAQRRENFSDRIDVISEFLKTDITKLKDNQRFAFLEQRRNLRDVQKMIKDYFGGIPLGLRRLLDAFPRLRAVFHLDEIERLKDVDLEDKQKNEPSEKDI